MSDPAATWQRLHWSSLIFRVLSHASQILLPGLVVIFFASGDSWQKWAMVFFPLVMIGEVFRYISVRYRTDGNELVVKRGLIWKNVRNVPCERIQNLDLVQNPLHRAFGVAEVRIETASGTEPEAVLKVLTLDAVEALRTGIFANGKPAVPASGTGSDGPIPVTISDGEGTSGELVIEVPRGELVRLGIISNRGLAFVAIAIGLLAQANVLSPRKLFRFVERRIESIDLDSVVASGLSTLIVAVIGGVLLIALYFLLSIVMTMLRLDGYTLRRVGDDLRISCGMFTRISTTIPRRRVQIVTVTETWLHRLFGRASVRIQTAGGSANDGKDVGSRRWFIPIARPDQVPALMRAAGLDHGLERAEWIPPAPGARRRMLKKNTIVAMLMSVIGLAFWFPWGGLALAGLLVPLSAWIAWREAALMAHARVDDCLLFRSGVLTRRISVVRDCKVQSVAVAASPFDRRHGMAALHLDTAGSGPINQGIRIPYLRADDADRLGSAIVQRAEDEGFVW